MKQKFSLQKTSRNIFFISVILYILLDVSERLLGFSFDAWIFLTIFFGILFAISLASIEELEKKIMEKIKN